MKMKKYNHRRWTDTENHLVLFMDIMGFKDRVVRKNHESLLHDFENFINNNERLKPLLNDGKGELIRLALFSDSIILATIDASKQSLNRIVKAATVLMHNALEVGFPIKGAISLGPVTFDNNKGIYFGQSIVDSYLLEEELKFYGIVFHHSVELLIEEYLKNPPKRGRNSLYIPVEFKKISLKSGLSKHYTIAYHTLRRDLSRGDYRKNIEKWLSVICKSVSGSPRIYLDNTYSFLGI